MNIAKPAPKSSILIVLAYWEGDRELARKVAQLMVDLQPNPVGSICEVLVVARQDCAIDSVIVETLKTKFTVHTFTSNSPLRGWPGGCNGMFGSSMIEIANHKNHFDVVFWMEADCVPMCLDWFAHLLHEWKNRPDGTHIVGCKCDANGNGTGIHITGCALYDPQIARIMPAIASAQQWAWDWMLRAEICRVGHHTNSIGLQYKARNASQSLLNGPWSVIHGVKDESLLNLVRTHRVDKVPLG